jgi:plasmid stabilization system protein ParE
VKTWTRSPPPSPASIPKAALRFLDEFDAAVDRLLQFPELAQVWPTNRPDTLANVRRLVLRGFRVSSFYRPTDTTLEVLRVPHHARHAPPLLDDLQPALSDLPPHGLANHLNGFHRGGGRRGQG